MILINPKEYGGPNGHSVERALERCGYNYYVPMEILKDLVCLCAHHMMRGHTGGAFVDNPRLRTPFEQELINFYTTLKIDLYFGTSPLHRAIFILKDLSTKVNLRKMEMGIEAFASESEHNNYVEEISVDGLNVMTGDRDVDSDEIAEILKLSVSLFSQLNIGDNQKPFISLERIKNFTNIFKVKKSSLVRPDFNYKLINKQLMVENTIYVPEGKPIVYLEDSSSSMLENKGYTISKAIQYLLMKSPAPVHYYRYAAGDLEFYELNNIADKITCFSASKKHYVTDCDYEAIFKLISSKYSEGSVILLTDGDDYIPHVDLGSMVFNVITTVQSVDTKSLAKRTGGKFILT